MQEQLVTKFPFVRGRKAPASAEQSPLLCLAHIPLSRWLSNPDTPLLSPLCPILSGCGRKGGSQEPTPSFS